MTRVVFLCHSAAPSGAELSLVRSLQRWRSVRDAVVVFGQDGPLVEVCRESGIEAVVHRLPASATRARLAGGLAAKLRALVVLVGYSRSLAAVVRAREPDLVVARSLKALAYGSMTAKRLRTPLVWSVHDRISAEYMGWFGALLYGRLGPLLSRGLIVNSQSTLATLTVGRKPVLVLPPGIYLDPRPARNPEAPISRVVVLGRLAPWKGQDLAIRAFEKVFADTDAVLDIVGAPLFGEEGYENELRALAAGSPCAGRINFHGHQVDPFGYLADADVMVHSSRIPEPFGAVVIEGMWGNCVVIATTPGGPAEVIDNGVSGLLIPCADVDELERTLSEVGRWPAEHLRALAASGRSAARAFDAKRLALVMEDWLHDLSAGRANQSVVAAVPARNAT